MATFPARFPGKCKVCGKRFRVGTLIAWTKLDGAAHAVCPNRKASNWTPNPAPYNGDGLDSADRAELDMARREREADDFEYSIGYAHGLDCGCGLCRDFDARTY